MNNNEEILLQLKLIFYAICVLIGISIALIIII